MHSQYLKYVPVVICVSILLCLTFGESYITEHAKDSSFMTSVSEHRSKFLGLFALLSAGSYYWFVYRKPVVLDTDMSIKLPSYLESVSEPSKYSSNDTSVTE
jgi:hypothetical protein